MDVQQAVMIAVGRSQMFWGDDHWIVRMETEWHRPWVELAPMCRADAQAVLTEWRMEHIGKLLQIPCRHVARGIQAKGDLQRRVNVMTASAEWAINWENAWTYPLASNRKKR